MVALALTAAFASCSNDDNEDQAPVHEEQIPVAPVVHYDLTVTVDKHGGMGRDVTTIMQSRERLDAGDVVNFENIGAEINADYTMEAITRGNYYYQVPNSEDRFVKLQFKDNKMHVVQAQPFKENTYNKRQYTHTWLNDNTLIIMAANGNKNAIVWTKLKTDDMPIISEGTLDLALEGDWDSFTTSGILAYRQNDNKLFYFYYMKKGTGRKATKETNFRVAVINAETMAVEQKSQCLQKWQVLPMASCFSRPPSPTSRATSIWLRSATPKLARKANCSASRWVSITLMPTLTDSPIATANCSPLSILATAKYFAIPVMMTKRIWAQILTAMPTTIASST